MPDGSKRSRRNGKKGDARRKWYAKWRNLRQAKRFWENGYKNEH